MNCLWLPGQRLRWVQGIPEGSRCLLGILVLASVLCSGLVLGRVIVTVKLKFLFLPGNLVLAWIPLLIAGSLWRMHAESRRRTWSFVLGSLLWLSFLPNAPYLVTDLIHLRPRPPIPIWMDLAIFVSFLWLGVVLGFFSLFLMQRVVTERFGRIHGWLFVLVALVLTALGIYIGRFLRWNSWDMVIRPIPLARDLFDTFRHPRLHPQPYLYAALYSHLLFLFYATLYSLTRFRLDQANTAPALPAPLTARP